jgi:hypothetical protein
MAIGLILLGTPPALADDAVKLKVLVVTTGDITQDAGLAYIQPVLDEMGVGYDVLDASTKDLTAATLSPASCLSTTVGCVGNYNGVILTDSGMGGNLTASEWDALHNYEKDFHVREAVLSGWPGTYWDPISPSEIYLDYGLTYSSSITSTSLPAVSAAKWVIPATSSKTVFEYVNTANPLPITDFAFAAKPNTAPFVLRDGTQASVTPLLQTPAGEALVSAIQYKIPLQTTVVREVLLSTISNASFLTHSQVLGYEFVNWVTKGVFVGARFVYMSTHLDDLFLANDQWDVNANITNSLLTYRLTSTDISNAVNQQNTFRAASKHPTAGTTFMLDFAFNGSGAVANSTATKLELIKNDGLVSAVIKSNGTNNTNNPPFRFINHTFTHADMDKAPVPANAPCDYPTLTTTTAIQAEITKNQTVWGLLKLPDQANNNRVLVTGNHSGLKDRKCTDDAALHPTMVNVQDDDVPFFVTGSNPLVTGINPLFITAAAKAGVNYLASDTSQINQNVEQYITNALIDDSKTTDRLILPRWPTNIFYNVSKPSQLVDEYNYIYYDRYVSAGQNPCSVAGAICTKRTYAQILTAEATAAVQHMMSYKKYPHFFHQANVARYTERVTGGTTTIQFDWLNSVYTAYEKLFKLPVKNLPYYTIGDMTKDRLTAKSAVVTAIWNRATTTNPVGSVTLSSNIAVPNLLVTGVELNSNIQAQGLQRGELYGGQIIRAVNVGTTPVTVNVNQALVQ